MSFPINGHTTVKYELERVSFSSVLVSSVASVQTYRLLFSGAAGSSIQALQ